MKFSVNLPNPTDVVTPEKIPGGADNINGKTFQDHFAEAGIVAFTLDMTEIGMPLKTYATFHMLHKGFGDRAQTCAATKRNKLLYRTHTVCAVVTDLPFVKNPSLADTFLNDMFGLIWSKLTNREKLYIDAKGYHEPCMTLSPDYTELVTELRSWPQRVVIDDGALKGVIESLKTEYNSRRAITPAARLQQTLRNQIQLSHSKMSEAIKISGVTDEHAACEDKEHPVC